MELKFIGVPHGVKNKYVINFGEYLQQYVVFVLSRLRLPSSHIFYLIFLLLCFLKHSGKVDTKIWVLEQNYVLAAI